MTCTGACNFGDGCNCLIPLKDLLTVKGGAAPLLPYGGITRCSPWAGLRTVPQGNAWWNSNVMSRREVMFKGIPVVVDPTLPESTIVIRNDRGDEVRVENLGEAK